MNETMPEEQAPEPQNEPEETGSDTSSKRAGGMGFNMGSKKNIIAIVIIVLAIFGALEITGKTHFLSSSKAVAYVNGEKITQSDFDLRVNQILSSPQAQGLNLDDPSIRDSIEQQILTEIINTRLLLQNAKDAGIEIGDGEVDAEYRLMIERLGSEEVLLQEVKKGGLTEDEFRKNIADQLMIQAYLDDNVDTSSTTATEEEVQAFYDENVAGSDGAPALADIRTQIEDQIVSVKQQQLIGDFIALLRKDADIKIVE